MRWNIAFLGLLILALVACAPEEAEVDTTAPGSTAMTDTAAPVVSETSATVVTEVPPPTGTPATATVAENGGKQPPKTHTVDRGGVMHAPGGENPTQKCAACHGKDLRGGKVAAVSCYDCHDAVWEGESEG